MEAMRRWFGPSREEIWRQLSEQLGARFVESTFWKGNKVEATHRDWVVTLDTYTVSTGKTHMTFTRMRAPYVNPLGFRFTIYRKSAFSGIGKFLGMQDIEIGEPAFDDAFIVKATDESQVRSLLANPKIRQLLEFQPAIHFSVKDDEGWFCTRFPEGVDELSFAVHGVIKDIERLKALYDLFALTLDELVRIGAAHEGPASVEL